MRRSQRSFNVEMMEGRLLQAALVSTVHPAVYGPVAVAPAATTTQVALNGSASGTLSNALTNGPSSASASGTATFGTLGSFALSGTVAYVTAGNSGMLTLSNAQGSLTLQLTHESSPHPSPNGTYLYTFSVVSSSGAYAGNQDTGSISLKQTLTPGLQQGGVKFSLSITTY